MTERTTIQLTKSTKEKIASLGEKRETMEDIILKLLAAYHKPQNMQTAKLWANGSYKFGTENANKTIRYIIEE